MAVYIQRELVVQIKMLLTAASMLLSFLYQSPIAGQNTIVLEKVDVHRDTASVSRVYVVFSFNTHPVNFPIYALNDPYRMVIDLTDTRTTVKVQVPVPQNSLVVKADIIPVQLDSSSNIRIEIGLRSTAYYRAYLSGKDLILALSPATEGHGPVSLFFAAKTSDSFNSIKAIDMMNIDGREHLEVQFTDLPQSASIYKMEKPARVVMDFYGTYAEKDSIYILDNPHIKSIAVKHQDLISPYAGITVFLRNNASFAYQQVGNSIIVDVFSRKLLTKKNVMMLVGAGAVLAGGTATGILLGGQKEKPGDKKKDDLGLPPGFPGE